MAYAVHAVYLAFSPLCLFVFPIYYIHMKSAQNNTMPSKWSVLRRASLQNKTNMWVSLTEEVDMVCGGGGDTIEGVGLKGGER